MNPTKIKFMDMKNKILMKCKNFLKNTLLKIKLMNKKNLKIMLILLALVQQEEDKIKHIHIFQKEV